MATPRKKSPTTEVQYRIDVAEQLLLQGLTHRQAEKVLRDQFSVHRRSASRYVAAAYTRWREAADQEDGRSIQERRKEHEWMIRRTLSRAAKENRLDLQLKAVDMLMRLYGTAQSTKVEVTGKDGGPMMYAKMSEDELKRLLVDADVTIEAIT